MKHLVNREGKTFEFRGTFKLKREYEKENQKAMAKELLKAMSPEDMEKFNLGSEEEKKVLLMQYSPELDFEEITIAINRKYIKTLLCMTNNIADDEAEMLLMELDEDYGEEQVNKRFAEILNEVFTRVGNAEYKLMPTWD